MEALSYSWHLLRGVFAKADFNLVAFVLVPFSLFTQTTFIAERPLGWVVTAGVRFMLLTLVIGLGEAMFGQLKIDPQQFTVRAALDVALGAVVLMVLALTASRLATDLATGTPRLGALDAAAALGGTALAGTYAVRRSATAINQTASGLRGAASFLKLSAVKAAAAMKAGKAATENEVPKASPADDKTKQGPL